MDLNGVGQGRIRKLGSWIRSLHDKPIYDKKVIERRTTTGESFEYLGFRMAHGLAA